MSIGLTPARIFAVTDEDFVKIKKLIEHADTYMLGYKEMHRIQSGMDPPPGQDPARCCIIGEGNVRVTLTHEQHPEGQFRHISMGYADGKYMSPHIMIQFLPLFGFKADETGKIDVRLCWNDEQVANVLHFLQRIDEPSSEHAKHQEKT